MAHETTGQYGSIPLAQAAIEGVYGSTPDAIDAASRSLPNIGRNAARSPALVAPGRRGGGAPPPVGRPRAPEPSTSSQCASPLVLSSSSSPPRRRRCRRRRCRRRSLSCDSFAVLVCQHARNLAPGLTLRVLAHPTRAQMAAYRLRWATTRPTPTMAACRK